MLNKLFGNTASFRRCVATLKSCAARAKLCSASLGLVLFFSFSTAQAENRDEMVFFFNDALGSAVAAVNENGDLCWSEEYTPYGDKTVNDDVFSPIGSGCGIVGEERGFTGHTEDGNSDLVYMQQRYYDPSIGRFLSIDPRDANPASPVTYNRYAYANNNPYKYVDPDGEFAIMATIAIVGLSLTAYDAYTTYKSEGAAAAAKDAGIGMVLTAATGGTVKIGATIGKHVGKRLGQAKALRDAEAARDATAEQMKRKHATYAGGYKDGKVASGCSSNPSGCSEEDIARQLGSDANMTGAKGYRRNKTTGELEYRDIPVCTNCQNKFDRSQFPDDVTFQEGGRWSE